MGEEAEFLNTRFGASWKTFAAHHQFRSVVHSEKGVIQQHLIVKINRDRKGENRG